MCGLVQAWRCARQFIAPLLISAGIWSLNAAEPTRTATVRALSSGGRAQAQSVHFDLKLRDRDELARRVAKHEVISVDELQRKYFPSADAWRRVAAWARTRGYSVEEEDELHMTVFAAAPIAALENSLNIRFARAVNANGVETSVASEVPAIPEELADVVLTIASVQPMLRPRRAGLFINGTLQGAPFVLTGPDAIRQFYHVDSTGLDGAGETVVVVGNGRIQTSDLVAFWSKCGLPTTLKQFTELDPSGVDPADDPFEPTCDIEWITAIAPRANIVYISTTDPAAIARTVLNRASSDATLHQLSESYLLAESVYEDHIAPLVGTDYYLALTAAGVTMFACTGDYGSNTPANPYLRFYDPSGRLRPAYPASDPYVVAVGGTALGFSGPNLQLPLLEGAWTLPDPPFPGAAGQLPNYGISASTGGVSVLFPRPIWQIAPNLPGGTMRCVPDVSAPAVVFPSAYAYCRGDTGFYGTSLSCPIWAGFCALLNQARAKAGLQPVGLLTPRLYALAGTGVFNQITTGSNNGSVFTTTANNGAYSAGPTYNLVTGLGSPNVDRLIAALTVDTSPTFNAQPHNQVGTYGGKVTFSSWAIGEPAPIFRWFMDGVPVVDGIKDDGMVVNGATTSELSLSNITSAENGAYFQVQASNRGGAAISNSASLNVSVPATIVSSLMYGQRLPLTAPSAEAGTAFQWYVNDVPILGATSAIYNASFAGRYTVIETGRDTSRSYTVAVLTSTGRQINVSTRALVTSGLGAEIAGFVIAGAPGTTKQVLIRGIGPGLGAYGIGELIARPVLTLYGPDSTPWAVNSGWQAPITWTPHDGLISVRAATSEDMSSVGAFSIAAGSSDSALVATLAPGTYSIGVANVGDVPGVGMVEVYEKTQTDSAILANLSSRVYVGPGDGAAIIGFVSTGPNESSFLIRAIGPTLKAFGVSSTLDHPALTVRDSAQHIIAVSRGWQNPLAIGTGLPAKTAQTATPQDMQNVGAFSLPPGSDDSAMIVTLPPGAYTAEVTGSNQGIVLVESYQMKLR